jgi:TRAP-type C4-dicarboxylate transport system permease small subunit
VAVVAGQEPGVAVCFFFCFLIILVFGFDLVISNARAYPFG